MESIPVPISDDPEVDRGGFCYQFLFGRSRRNNVLRVDNWYTSVYEDIFASDDPVTEEHNAGAMERAKYDFHA
jgi:hypothetical protein